jgi:hypothetical protein
LYFVQYSTPISLKKAAEIHSKSVGLFHEQNDSCLRLKMGYSAEMFITLVGY